MDESGHAVGRPGTAGRTVLMWTTSTACQGIAAIGGGVLTCSPHFGRYQWSRSGDQPCLAGVTVIEPHDLR